MSCPHCAEKDDRIAWLESELGGRLAADLVDRIRSALIAGGRQSKRAGAAKLIAALYDARGRTMTRPQLSDALPSTLGHTERSDKIIDVWVCHARKSLGKDAIENVWGRGYRLTPIGMARVAAILNPNPQQAAA